MCTDICLMASHCFFALSDAIVVPIITFFSAIYGGFVIFAIVGFMAYDVGLEVDEVITSGKTG